MDFLFKFNRKKKKAEVITYLQKSVSSQDKIIVAN